jgi:hypothetical protein
MRQVLALVSFYSVAALLSCSLSPEQNDGIVLSSHSRNSCWLIVKCNQCYVSEMLSAHFRENVGLVKPIGSLDLLPVAPFCDWLKELICGAFTSMVSFMVPQCCLVV